MNTPAGRKISKTYWGVVWLTVGAGLMAASHVGKVAMGLPQVQADLGLNMAEGGLVSSVFTGAGVLLGLFAGTIADTIGRRRVMITGLLILAAASLWGSLAESGAVLIFTRFVEGIGFTTIVVTGAAIVTQAAHENDRKRALSFWGLYFPNGIALLVIIAPPFLTIWDWRALWQFNGVLTVIWLIVFAIFIRGWVPPAGPRQSLKNIFSNVSQTLARPGAWLITGLFTFYALQQLSFMTWVPTFMITEVGLSASVTSWLTALTLVINGFGNITAGILLSRGWLRWRICFLNGVVLAISEVVMFASISPDMAKYAGAIAFSYVGGMLPTAVFASAPLFAPTPRQIATINGFIVMGTSLGQLIGPPVLGAIVEASGQWFDALWMMLGCAAAVIVLALMTRPLERRALAG